MLQASLEHFHHSPDFGDGRDAELIKGLLQLRIREAESAMRFSAYQQTKVA